MQNRACSFTGHRQISSAHVAALPELLGRAIAYVYENGVRTFYSGGAIGFDTVAALEVIRFKETHPDVSLALLLPCRNQDARWSARQRAAYKSILERADRVIYVTDGEYKDGCMRLRNIALVDRADVIIAYAARYGSGTAQTLAMARAAKKQVYNLYTSLP